MLSVAALMNEHRLIERVCDALLAFSQEGPQREPDGRSELARFVSFVREFADRLHHCKEEDILFAVMIKEGFGQGDGPVARMLVEHDIVRRHIKALKDLAAQPRPWTVEDRDRTERGARAYVELLHEHIDVEDSVVFPFAERNLSPDIQAQVDASCARFEASEAASIRRMTMLGEELVSRYTQSRRR